MDKADFSIVDTLDEMRYELDATPNARYGGYYYTENMKRMKVCIPHGQPPLPIRASASSYVGTVWVDNSLDMLDDAYEAATSILNQHGLNAVTIDVLTNCVALGVDEDTPQVRDELLRKLAKLGTGAATPFTFHQEDRAEGMDLDCCGAPLNWVQMKDGSSWEDCDVVPGGWLGYGDSVNSIKGVRSVTCAVLYDGRPFFLTAGHTKIAVDDQVFYAAPPSSGVYPEDLRTMATSAVPIGNVAMKKLGGYFDFASIERTNGRALARACAYNGLTLCGDASKPAVGEIVRYTGVADKSVETSVKSLKSAVSYYGQTMKNIVAVYGTGSNGTSGGPLMRNISGKEYLVGLASCRKPATGVTFFTYFKEVKDAYKLTPVFPEGT
ncbi:MAG: hypothetical protein RSC06_14340 [Clostridia bacterium]